MGGGGSKSAGGWHPSPPSGAAPRKISKAGFDVTPLSEEERQRYAEGLTDFQKYV